MLIDFISDLHFEINGNIKLEKEPGGDILILPGDITCMRFFRLSRTDAEARKIQKRKNITNNSNDSNLFLMFYCAFCYF